MELLSTGLKWQVALFLRLLNPEKAILVVLRVLRSSLYSELVLSLCLRWLQNEVPLLDIEAAKTYRYSQ